MTAARSDLPTLDGGQHREDDDEDVDTLGLMTHNLCPYQNSLSPWLKKVYKLKSFPDVSTSNSYDVQ